jgi:ribosomal protein L7Ae-like RNA K-turn-binding protein
MAKKAVRMVKSKVDLGNLLGLNKNIKSAKTRGTEVRDGS